MEDALVVWSGEFGRTPIRGNRGETDPSGYTAAETPVHLRDLHATLPHLLGFDPHGLSVPFQGLDQRLIGVLRSRIIYEISA